MIKKLLFITALVFSVNCFGQQVDFGLQAGYTNVEGKSSNSLDDFSYSGSSSGFYLGVLADIEFSEQFHLQPSVNYANADETSLLVIPVMVQYYIENSGFYVQAGPQATLILENTSLNGVDILNTFGLDAAFGAGYQITENFFVEAKYSLELTNRFSNDIKDAAEIENVDVDSQLNALSIGVGYKF